MGWRSAPRQQQSSRTKRVAAVWAAMFLRPKEEAPGLLPGLQDTGTTRVCDITARSPLGPACGGRAQGLCLGGRRWPWPRCGGTASSQPVSCSGSLLVLETLRLFPRPPGNLSERQSPEPSTSPGLRNRNLPPPPIRVCGGDRAPFLGPRWPFWGRKEFPSSSSGPGWVGRLDRRSQTDRRGEGTHFTQARPDPEASLRPRRADGRDRAFALRVRCRRRPGGRRMLRAQEVRVRNRETPQACPSGPFGAFVSRGDHLLSSGLGGPLSLEIRAVVPGRRARGPEAFSSNSSAEDAGSARVSVFRDSSQTYRKRMEAFVWRVAARYWRK